MSIYICMFKRFFDEIFVLLDFDRNGNERRLFNKMYWKLFGRRFIFSWERFLKYCSFFIYYLKLNVFFVVWKWIIYSFITFVNGDRW